MHVMHGHRDEIINGAECSWMDLRFSKHIQHATFFLFGKRASLIDGVEPEEASP
jgi:hypothetical protein